MFDVMHSLCDQKALSARNALEVFKSQQASASTYWHKDGFKISKFQEISIETAKISKECSHGIHK